MPIIGIFSSNVNSFRTLFGTWSVPEAELTLIRPSSHHIWDPVTGGTGPIAGSTDGKQFQSRGGRQQLVSWKMGIDGLQLHYGRSH